MVPPSSPPLPCPAHLVDEPRQLFAGDNYLAKHCVQQHLAAVLGTGPAGTGGARRGRQSEGPAWGGAARRAGRQPLQQVPPVAADSSGLQMMSETHPCTACSWQSCYGSGFAHQ